MLSLSQRFLDANLKLFGSFEYSCKKILFGVEDQRLGFVGGNTL